MRLTSLGVGPAFALQVGRSVLSRAHCHLIDDLRPQPLVTDKHCIDLDTLFTHKLTAFGQAGACSALSHRWLPRADR